MVKRSVERLLFDESRGGGMAGGAQETYLIMLAMVWEEFVGPPQQAGSHCSDDTGELEDGATSRASGSAGISGASNQ